MNHEPHMSERVVYYYQDVNSISWRNSSRLFCHKVGQKVDHCFFLSKLREMSRNEAVEAVSFFFVVSCFVGYINCN